MSRQRKNIQLSKDEAPREYDAALALAGEWGVSVEEIDYDDARWRVLNEECEKHAADGFFGLYRQSRVGMVDQLLREKSFGKSPRSATLETFAQECIYLAYAGPSNMEDTWLKAKGRPAGRLSELWGANCIPGPEMKIYSETFGTPDAALLGIMNSRSVAQWRQLFPIDEDELRGRFKQDWLEYLEVYGPRKLGSLSVRIKDKVPREGQPGLVDYDFEFHCNACGGYVLTIPDSAQKGDKVTCKACGRKLCTYGELMSHLNDLALMDAAQDLG